MIGQAKFTYHPLGKALEKQTKAIAYMGKKKIKTIADHKLNIKIHRSKIKLN